MYLIFFLFLYSSTFFCMPRPTPFPYEYNNFHNQTLNSVALYFWVVLIVFVFVLNKDALNRIRICPIRCNRISIPIRLTLWLLNTSMMHWHLQWHQRSSRKHSSSRRRSSICRRNRQRCNRY